MTYKLNDSDNEALNSKAKVFSIAFICVATVNLMFTVGFQGLTTAMPLYISELGGSGLAMGLSTMIVTATALGARVVVGFVLDHSGCKLILIASMLITLLSVCMYAVFPFVESILFFRAINGIGLGLGTTATATMAAKLLPKNRFAEGLGYFAMTSSVGGAIGPALLVFLIQNAGALVMVTVAASFSFAALILSMFTKETKNASVKDDDKNKQLQQSGINRFIEFKAIVPSLSMTLVNIGFASIITFIAAHAQILGIQGISIYFVIYAVTNIVTRPVIGKIIDARGVKIPGVIACICMAVVLLAISFADSLLAFCCIGVLTGLGQGTCMGAFQTTAVVSSDYSRRGVATATFLFGFDLGIAIGSILSGMFVQGVGYRAMYLIVALFPLLAALVFAKFHNGKIS